MPRYVYGPSSHDVPVRGDLVMAIEAIEAVEGVQHVRLTVPPTDPAIHSRPTRVFAAFSPAPPGPDETPQGFLGGPGRYVGVADAAGDPAQPLFLAIPVPGVPAGVWVVQTVVEYPD